MVHAPRERQAALLQVEDDTPTQHLRAEIFRRAGFQVTNARTVREALAAAAKKRPDVVLCDVKLPDGSGFQICREMQSLHPGVPVVLISAVYRDEYAKDSAVYGGAAEYLVEPVTAKELVACIGRHLPSGHQA